MVNFGTNSPLFFRAFFARKSREFLPEKAAWQNAEP